MNGYIKSNTVPNYWKTKNLEIIKELESQHYIEKKDQVLYSIYVRVFSDFNLDFHHTNMVDTSVSLISSFNRTVIIEHASTFRNISVYFSSMEDMNIVLDIDSKFRPLFFGARFFNMNALRPLLMNYSSLLTKSTGREHSVKLFYYE